MTNDLPNDPICIQMLSDESINLDDMNDWNLAVSLARTQK